MTTHKHLKQLIRARMAKTGERYAAARRSIVAEQPSPHLGSVPASASLRALLEHAGASVPGLRRPLSEAMVFGLGGGVGAGVFAFHYAKEDISTFYVGGRHVWQDDLAWFEAACRRLGFAPTIAETSSRKAAEEALRRAVAGGRPAVAWVDAASLPHRGLPGWLSGGGYHVVTVLAVEGEVVRIADLTDRPIEVPMATFAAARARIAKQRHRLLWLEGAPAAVDLRAAVDDALAACRAGMHEQRLRNFTVHAFADWAARLAAPRGKESWAVMFAPGHRLFAGLRWAHAFIEHEGTGGGLCRPLFAAFLDEAARALADDRLGRAAETYRALGEAWSGLADALLDDAVPLLAEAKQIMAERHEAVAAGAPPEELRRRWEQLDALAERARVELLLGEAQAQALREGLAERVRSLHARELDALAQLGGAA